jgi:hypothetical protein
MDSPRSERPDSRALGHRVQQKIVAAGVNAHAAGIDTGGDQVRSTIGVLYFVSKMTPGIEAEAKTKAEAIIQLEIVFSSRHGGTADTAI